MYISTMQVDWRGLLSEIRVQWRDRGSNTSRGNVNVPCPYCENDPSFHMGISESREAFYCFREPNRHSGSSFIRLLIALGVTRSEAVLLLNRYQRSVSLETERPKAIISQSSIINGWSRFSSAAESSTCLDYLRYRGFPNPVDTALRYDLRFAKEGTWAQRLLIPIVSVDNQIISWTGRSLKDRTPKYLTLGNAGAMQPYVPSIAQRGKSILVIVEGPMDALKGADACRRDREGQSFVFAALAGKQITPTKLLALRALTVNCVGILLALDADVTLAASYSIQAELASAIKLGYIALARLPRGFKDPAEMPAGEIAQWLNAVVNEQLASS